MAVVGSNPLMPRNGDQFFPFRQHSDFYYLTGIGQVGSVLVFCQGRETLFIQKPDPKKVLWSGPVISPEEASQISGIGDVRWLEEMDGYLMENAREAVSFFLNLDLQDGSAAPVKSPAAGIYEKLEKIYPRREYSSTDQIMTQLRMVKEPEEIEQIREACRITRVALEAVARDLKPGMHEYEVEAMLTSQIVSAGAMGHAFEPIVAAGKNALTLHYVENSGRCNEGDLLLIDFGAEVNYYAADCTRTLPVGGRYSRRQREVYEAVFRVFQQARSLMNPGIKIGDYHNQVGNLWEEEHIKLGLYNRKDVENQPESDPLWKRYYVHGTSHSLGLDVHDPFDRSVEIKAGMVLTCEPAIYIPEEGIGIRLENDILITGDGPVDLMGDMLLGPDEIEGRMSN